MKNDCQGSCNNYYCASNLFIHILISIQYTYNHADHRNQRALFAPRILNFSIFQYRIFIINISNKIPPPPPNPKKTKKKKKNKKPNTTLHIYNKIISN